jgi:hypothetical protein
MNDKLIKIARSFGAEAYANGGRTMYNSGDREDMAYHYGVSSWADIPIEDRNELARAFFEGVEAERKNKPGC